MSEIVFVLLVGVLVLVGVGVSVRRRRAHREEFVRMHIPMSDAEFLEQLGVEAEDQGRACVAICRALADAMQVAPETIHPSDTICALIDLGSPGWYSAVTEAIEEATGTEIDTMFPMIQNIEGTGPMEAETISEFLHWYLDDWDRMLPRK